MRNKFPIALLKSKVKEYNENFRYLELYDYQLAEEVFNYMVENKLDDKGFKFTNGKCCLNKTIDTNIIVGKGF